MLGGALKFMGDNFPTIKYYLYKYETLEGAKSTAIRKSVRTY